MSPIRVGLVGVGKIARDQHIPVLRANPDFALIACASRHSEVNGVSNFATLEAMLDGNPELDAIAICSPPQAHYDAAKLALVHGKHVLLEKPPCTSTAQLDHLVVLAAGRTLFQTWHSQHAQGVAPARHWLKHRKLRRVQVTWKEDVRQWHPGQTWIWQAGGFGVFDPGINALSILTAILPEPFFVRTARLQVPSNCQSPIAAEMQFTGDSGTEISAEFDFRHTGVQTWDIEIETDDGMLKLSQGGSVLQIDGKSIARDPGELHSEYESIYAEFGRLIRERRSKVDARPFQLVADIFMMAERHSVEPFED